MTSPKDSGYQKDKKEIVELEGTRFHLRMQRSFSFSFVTVISGGTFLPVLLSAPCAV